MQTYKVNAHLPANRHIEITLPDDFPQGAAEVIVLTRRAQMNKQIADERDARDDSERRVESARNKCKSSDERPLSDDFFAWYDRQPPGPHSEEEIAAWIAEEREAWGDD